MSSGAPPIKAVDIFAVPAPAALVADAQALDVDLVLGYAWDDDVTMVNPWTAAHVAALGAAGIPFGPILTLRSGTAATAAQLVDAVQSLGVTAGPFLIDLEPTAEPAAQLVAGVVAGFKAAGFGPAIAYCYPNWSVRNLYPTVGFDYWWYAEGSGAAIPAGWDGCQYGQAKGPSGATYDLDLFTATVAALFGGGDLTPEEHTWLQQTEAWLAGSGNTMLGQVGAIYAQGAGTVNTIAGTVEQLEAQVKVLTTNDAARAQQLTSLTQLVQQVLAAVTPANPSTPPAGT